MKSDKGILKPNRSQNRFCPDKKILLRFSAGDEDDPLRNSMQTEQMTNQSLIRKSVNAQERQHMRSNSIFSSRKRLKCIVPSKSLPPITRPCKMIAELKKVPPLRAKKIIKFDEGTMDIYTYRMRKNLEDELQVNMPIVVKNGKPLEQNCCAIY